MILCPEEPLRQAWLREQKLVSDGKGTRDWTPEPQEEILTYGKAYYHSDDPNDVNDGKAFEGHHMKSADAYPEYQRDSGNIQFLSRSEHHEAHNGDYRDAICQGQFSSFHTTTMQQKGQETKHTMLSSWQLICPDSTISVCEPGCFRG
ncbi:MAG: hypothetical protein LUE61_00685 [Clostridiales bacterium]|nr:hypothetical protein [Clostridiales bacterium]